MLLGKACMTLPVCEWSGYKLIPCMRGGCRCRQTEPFLTATSCHGCWDGPGCLLEGAIQYMALQLLLGLGTAADIPVSPCPFYLLSHSLPCFPLHFSLQRHRRSIPMSARKEHCVPDMLLQLKCARDICNPLTSHASVRKSTTVTL